MAEQLTSEAISCNIKLSPNLVLQEIISMEEDLGCRIDGLV